MSSRHFIRASSTFRHSAVQLATRKTPIVGRISRGTLAGSQSIGLGSFRRSYATSFSIQEILPPQDAFAQRHLGPRKSERDDMLRSLNLEV